MRCFLTCWNNATTPSISYLDVTANPLRPYPPNPILPKLLLQTLNQGGTIKVRPTVFFHLQWIVQMNIYLIPRGIPQHIVNNSMVDDDDKPDKTNALQPHKQKQKLHQSVCLLAPLGTHLVIFELTRQRQ